LTNQELAHELAAIADRMGTILEHIIAPCLPEIAEAMLDCGEMEFFAESLRKHRADGSHRLFEGLYVGKKAVMFNVTNARPTLEVVEDFADFLRQDEFFTYFPEYTGRPIVPVFSSIYLPDDLITYLTRHGIYAVGMGNEAMEVLNLEQVKRGQSGTV
jgi:hypothetical protein